MATNIIGSGDQIRVTLGGTVTAGGVWEGTDMIGVYLESGVSGDVVAVQVHGVEVYVDKETGVAFTQGQRVYWDATNNRVDATNTNIPCGMASRSAAAGDTKCYLLLNAGPAVS